MQETFDDILKAQAIYKKMVVCDDAQEFKKAFSDAISQHTLDEFYPVVVRAELSAILALSHRKKTQDAQFDYAGYMNEAFGLKPRHLVGMSLQTVADIMERDLRSVADMFHTLGYTVEKGKITHYDADGGAAKVVQLSDRRRTGNAA
ncbi:MAG: hypothetical protein GC185_00575 [Alphaproteobacteria bacterium]|nr:hypothetical protein [Alphaproteobacteria bacterium]